MLSIIVCSRIPWMLEALRENLTRNLGVPFELIPIDNSKNEYGICAAYNKGARKAIYPYLCFMHEDVLIETEGWGRKVVDYLKDPSVGLLGVAGGDAKSRVPSSWSIPMKSCEINIIQHFKDESKIPYYNVTTGDDRQETKKQVLLLDGVWLCTKKEVYQQFQFDEINFPGFHGYDLDYSLQVTRAYTAMVIFDIRLHHYSEGNPDKNWVEAAMQLSRKWGNQLPLSINAATYSEFREHHWKTLFVFTEHLFRLNYSPITILGYFHRYAYTRFFSLRMYLSVLKQILLRAKKTGL